MKNGTKAILVLLAVIFACGATVSGVMPQKTTGEIVMVQPCGWPWCMGYDAHYAQDVNEPNSRANLNNSEANKNNSEAKEPYMLMYAAGTFASIIVGGVIFIALGLGLVYVTVIGRRG
jgi:hypothetical protein